MNDDDDRGDFLARVVIGLICGVIFYVLTMLGTTDSEMSKFFAVAGFLAGFFFLFRDSDK